MTFSSHTPVILVVALFAAQRRHNRQVWIASARSHDQGAIR